MSEYIDTIIHRGKQYSDKDFEKKVPSLTYLGGGQVGRRIMLADDRITFGRSPKATIMLRDTHVSRLHIAIAFDPDRNGYRIQDLGSSNGTILNGTPHLRSHSQKCGQDSDRRNHAAFRLVGCV
jgi:pSer/pThr/pTyr-binding forkhead associated (FHA) protein